MEQDTEYTRVTFRKFADGDVIAFIGDFNPVTGMVMSYMHVGQHSDACYPGSTKPATPTEYADLLAELIRIGYRPRVVRRMVR